MTFLPRCDCSQDTLTFRQSGRTNAKTAGPILADRSYQVKVVHRIKVCRLKVANTPTRSTSVDTQQGSSVNYHVTRDIEV